MRSLTPPLRCYVVAVILAGMGLLIVLKPDLQETPVAGAAFFTVVALAAEAMPVAFPRGNATISVSFVVLYASILLFGPRLGAWIAAIGTLRLKDITGQVEPYKVLFNRSLLAICAGLAGLVYEWTGGVLFTNNPVSPWLPVAACGLTYIAVNTTLMVGVMSLQLKVPPWRMFAANFRWMLPNLLVFQPLGVMLAQVYVNQGATAVALFVIPLLVARYSFQLYIKMRKAYLETIMTLTASLDAKDPSTLGHSRRVAGYAVEIGKKLRLDDNTTELLQYLGVLHDIGKIGIRDTILKKPGIFTPAEYEEMKRHPVIGANIIASIRLLGKETSWVRHHHERYDGYGFPDGLKGEEIPLGARIIAVADAFDAITSARPYKRPLCWDMAISEMKRCAGSQFDPKVVEALIDIVDKMRPRKEPDSGPAITGAAQSAARAEREAAAAKEAHS